MFTMHIWYCVPGENGTCHSYERNEYFILLLLQTEPTKLRPVPAAMMKGVVYALRGRGPVLVSKVYSGKGPLTMCILEDNMELWG